MAEVAMIIGVAKAGIDAFGAHEQKKEMHNSLREQERIQIEKTQKNIKATMGMQRAIMATNGMSLSSQSAEFQLEETRVAGAEDIAAIQSYYNTQVGNLNRSTRASYIGSLTGAVNSVGSYANAQYSGVQTTTTQAGSK